MPVCLPCNRLLPLLAGAALAAALQGCTRYDDAQACADLSSMVWPWQGLEDATTTVTPVDSPLDTPLYHTEVVRVAGTLQRADGVEPLAASFDCVHRGDLLQTFGWAGPDAPAAPGRRPDRGTASPAAAW
jgi:hypothetical protein